MRIIGGTHRGTILTEVGAGDTAAHLRPTSDRVRENLFNVLMGGRFGRPVVGARVLDLFAGTGALGLEALSRGAAHATFVDNGKVAGKLVAANIAKLRRADDTAFLRSEAISIPKAPAPCDLVFIDPPYGQGLGVKALYAAAAQGWIAPEGLIVWEESTTQPAPAGFQRLDSKRYGETWITFLRATASA